MNSTAMLDRSEPVAVQRRDMADAAEQTRRFEEYIVPEMPFLARISRSMSHSQAEAEDLAQETLVKAFRAMDGFDGKHPRAWLARIARNTAINRDQRNREFLLPEEGIVEPEPDDSEDPEDIVLSGVVDEDLLRALDELPPSFRVVVQLVDVEEMSYKDAADALDIPLGTVMSRLHRARARLRRSLRGTPLDKERA
ncbi:MAG TPA: sigma-70 family RNA polymerase sigma factor [Actinomycetota bacterium]|nr:sigma-70 family RNA polymerase sigma factor [Actinomycetota bacterium]